MSGDEQHPTKFRPRLKLPKRLHPWPMGATLAITLVLIVLFLIYRDTNVWEGWREARELRNPSYGERIYEESIFRTRMNTWSNLAFILVGCYAIALAAHDRRAQYPLRRGYLAHTPAQSFFFGAVCVYLGIGSGLFHASLTRVGQQCDVGAMYAILVSYTALCLGSWFPSIPMPGQREPRKTWPWIIGAAIAASILFTVYKWSLNFNTASRPLTYILIAFVIFSLLHQRRKLYLRFFLGGIAIFAFAAWIRQLDIDKNFTGPDSLLQGHALWHVLVGVYLACMYLYFRSEERQ